MPRMSTVNSPREFIAVKEESPMNNGGEFPRHRLIVACIPAYNEDMTLPSVILKAQRFVDKILVYDDGSDDMTSDVASSLDAYVISNTKNQGKGVAMRRLFEQALEFNPDVTVTLDSDGQHDPNEIPKLIAPILRGEADIVIGSRFVEGSWSDAPQYRKMGLRVINFMNNGNGKKAVKDSQSGFRAFSRKALEAMLQCESNGYGIETEELDVAKMHNLKMMEVPVTVRYNGLAKTSKKNPVRHGVEIIDSILSLLVQRRPLVFLGMPGSILIMLGLFFGSYVLWDFNVTRYFSIPFALVAFGSFIVGVFLVTTSLILYGMSSLKNGRYMNGNALTSRGSTFNSTQLSITRMEKGRI